MPDENGAEAIRADDALFGDAAEKSGDTAAEAVEEKDADREPAQDPQVPNDGEDAAQDGQGSDDSKDETAPADELKVVVSIKEGRAVIGVQQPSSDPHIETFEGHDLPGLAEEVVAVAERAKAKWEETPKHPAYERPAPPTKRRNRRQQGAEQDATVETQEAETQQQTLGLF